MSETVSHDPAPAKRSSLKRRIVFIALLTVFFLLGVFGFLILGTPRRLQVDPQVSRAEAERMQAIIGKLTSSMVTPDGKMAQTAEIELSPAEINTLLRTGLRAAQLRRDPDLYYDAEWISGALRLQVSKIILRPFALNLDAELIPSINNGKVKVQVNSCTLGRLPLNSSLVSNEFQARIKEYEDSEEFRVLTEIVKSMTVRQDSILLVIRPQKINLLFSLLLKAAAGKSRQQ